MKKFKFLAVLLFFSHPVCWAQMPVYTVIPNALHESDLEILHRLTQSNAAKKQWYGRYTFWQEVFEARVSSFQDQISFSHSIEGEALPVINRLSSLFLAEIERLGAEITGKRIILESYLDRNVVVPDQMATSGMFWHRDVIQVDGVKRTAHYSMILLMNGKTAEWEGADLVLQQGGEYENKNSYSWINSEHPEVLVKPTYNQVIIFRNFDSGHKVTPLKPLSSEPVSRDVFITTCFVQ
jgi:hypothetical protein